MIVSWYGGQCLLVEERVRGETPRSALFYPATKTSRARTLEEKANVLIGAAASAEGQGGAYRITLPGEYDVAGFAIRGVPLASTADTVFVIESCDVALCHIGKGLSGRFSERDLDALGVIDILVFPVPVQPKASSPVQGISALVQAIEPHIVIPLLADAKFRAAVRRELGTEGETLSKLSAAAKDFPEEGFRVVYLEVQ